MERNRTKVSQQELIRNGARISMLYHAIRNGSSGLDDVPNLIKQIVQEKMWKSLIVEETGEVVEFASFGEFVKTAPPEGIGASLDTVKKLCRDDNEAMALIDEALGSNQGKRNDLNNFFNNIQEVHDEEAPVGTSRQAGLRRLRKLESEGNQKAATLRKRVLSNELSVNAALIELKLRPKTITLPLDPKKAAATIKRHFSTDDIEALIEELQ